MTKNPNSAKAIIVITFLFSLGYAILRYNIMGPVPWKDLPFYILNKTIALSSFILLIFNFSFSPLKNLGVNVPAKWLGARKALGATGFVMAVAHTLISLLLFKPAFYPGFFVEDGTLTLAASLSVLTGVLSFMVLWGYNASFQTFLREDKRFIKFITSRNFLLSGFVLGGLHLLFMGYSGWLNPSEWNGGMPPITLIAFTFFILGFGVNLLGRK